MRCICQDREDIQDILFLLNKMMSDIHFKDRGWHFEDSCALLVAILSYDIQEGPVPPHCSVANIAKTGTP